MHIFTPNYVSYFIKMSFDVFFGKIINRTMSIMEPQQNNINTSCKEAEVYRAHVEEEGGSSESSASLGTEARSKEEGKTTTYLCRPAEERYRIIH